MIIYILEQCKIDVQWYQEQLKDEERRENNILHELEGVATEDGCPPKYDQRATLATQLQNTLIARRIAKDNITINQPIVDFINSEIGREAINKLKQKLGEIRKIEKNLHERIYHKRKTDDIPNNPIMKQNLNKLIRDWKKNRK